MVRTLDAFFVSLQPRMKEMESLPGKKAIVILDAPSAGAHPDTLEYQQLLWDIISRFSDHAVRTGTTVYAYNVAGLEIPELFDASTSSSSLAFDPRGFVRLSRPPIIVSRVNWMWDALSRRTGGFVKSDNSFIINGLSSTMRDLNSYYILSFRPDPDAFHTAAFNTLTVRVKKQGLTARFPAGFFGASPEAQPSPVHAEALARALESPFSYQDLDVRLTSLFIGDRVRGSLVRSWLLLDTRRLTFLDEGDGGKSASLEAEIGLYKRGFLPLTHHSTRSIYVPDGMFDRALENGYTYNIVSPSLPPGDYVLRVAVMDRFTKKIGSAYQLVIVPDLKKDRLALSGLLMADKLLTENQEEESPRVDKDPNVGPGGRRFKLGMKVQYACLVYHPPRDKQTGRPRVEYQVRIIGEEGAVYTGSVQTVDLDDKPMLDPLIAGELTLGAPLKPGTYMLELTVSEPGTKKKDKSAIQIIDFQVV